jgi:ketosteroid isomerase-like protein
MKSSLRTIGLVLSSIFVALTWASGQEVVDPHAGSTVIALENAWNRALEFRDTKAVDSLLDTAAVFIDGKGRLRTKAEVLADVKAARVAQTVSEKMTVQLHGGVALVTGVVRTRGEEGGKPFVLRNRYIDTWIRKDGKWVCIASQETPMQH